MLAGTPHDESLGLGRAPLPRHRNRASTREIVAGHRVGHGVEACHGPGVDDLATVLARPGADIDDPVALSDRLLIVLDHEHGVAEIAEPGERVDQPSVVTLVQADRRLVEHIQGADQPRSDLAREPDALGLATGEGARGTCQSQVVEADV